MQRLEDRPNVPGRASSRPTVGVTRATPAGTSQHHPRSHTTLVATHGSGPPMTSATPSFSHSLDVFEAGAHHEQVVFCNDAATGLRAIIAIHSTALGPALGGTRFYPYASTGGRARRRPRPLPRHVLQGRARRARPRRRQGRDHRRPGAAASPRRCCAPTAGSCSRSAAATTPPATSARSPPTWTTSPASATYVTGRSVAHGGAGDSSVLTAYGVWQGMRAAARVRVGLAVPRRPDRRRRRRRQGRPPPGRPPGRGGRQRRRHRRVDRRARPGPRRAPRGPRGRHAPRRWSPSGSTSTRRAPWAAR